MYDIVMKIYRRNLYGGGGGGGGGGGQARAPHYTDVCKISRLDEP